jgi:hypothetical protein
MIATAALKAIVAVVVIAAGDAVGAVFCYANYFSSGLSVPGPGLGDVTAIEDCHGLPTFEGAICLYAAKDGKPQSNVEGSALPL